MHSENIEHKINITDLGIKLYLIYIYISEGLRHGGGGGGGTLCYLKVDSNGVKAKSN